MKTIYSRWILALVCLLSASTANAEEIDLKELCGTYENHLETNNSVTEYLFHLEHPMVVVIDHARSLADSTSIHLWEREENGTEYALVAEAHDHLRTSRTAYLWNRMGAVGKVRGDTLSIIDAQAFLCLSLPAGHYKLTSSRKSESIHASCLPELKTHIYAEAATASQDNPITVLLCRSGISCWNAAYRGKGIVYYQLSVQCNMTVDIESYETGSNTLILKDAKGVMIAQGTGNKIVRQALTPGNYIVSILVEEEYCKAGIRITATDEVGNTIEHPILLNFPGISYSRTEISQLADTYGEKEKDVFYSFALGADMTCQFSVYYSSMSEKSRVFLTVLNEKKEVIANASPRIYSTNLLCNLQPGMYYLVCEGGEGLDGALVVDVKFRPARPTPPDPEPNTDPEPQPEPEIPEQPENYAPSDSRNYIQIIVPTISSDSIAHFSYLSKARCQIQYYDHLGRPVQEIEYKASPAKTDLIMYREYDGLGRDSCQWLPVGRTGNGAGTWMVPSDFVSNAGKLYGDKCAYNLTVYDGSALNLIKEEYGPGEKWQTAGHGNRHGCLWLFGGGTREFPLLLERNIYPSFELLVETVEDEDGHMVYNFTNKRGNLILTRCIADNDTLDTYRVYDDYGNLCFILPPAAADNLSAFLLSGELPGGEACQAMLDQYAYQYRYDYRNRCTGKKLPGCDWMKMVYDNADRLLFIQDGEQRKKDEWSFQFSDQLGRSVLSGIYHGALDGRICNSQYVYAEFSPETPSAKFGYIVPDSAGFAIDSLDVLKADYYDTYDYKDGLVGFDNSLNYVADDEYGKQYVSSVQGLRHCKDLLTGSMTRALENGSECYSCFYYDYHRYLIQSRRVGMDRKVIVNKSSFNFSGQPVASCEEYDGVFRLGKRYTYDHAGRLTREMHVLGNDTTAFVYSFDEIGRLRGLSRIHGTDSLTTTNEYNIRNWLTRIDSPLFCQTLHYTDGAGTPCYNGNISSMTWSSSPSSSSFSSSDSKGYKFTYDGLSRLKIADYGEGNDLSQSPGHYNEHVTGYDKMGNILGLLRYGRTSATDYGLVDDLNLTYNGNRLQSVHDAATASVYGNGMDFKDGASQPQEYVYDANGNLIQDLNKNITLITYNCLNLPSRIEFGDGNSISYVYDADGTKLRSTRVLGTDTATTDYCGNVIYENGVATQLLTESGYITLADNKYHYYLKDYQGNNRVVVDETGNVEEVNDYYPFGGLMSSSSNSVQPYKYNGKELDRKGGLDWYDYGARMYDAAIGRWCAVDPMAEKYYGWSPYNYCVNNPVRLIDLNGMWPGEPLLQPFGRYQYGNNGLVNTFRFIHNTVASVVNTPINLVNGLADETQYIYNNGVGSYLSSGTKNIGNAIGSEVSYRINTPVSQQASDTWQAMKDPENWENAVATAALMLSPMKKVSSTLQGSASVVSTGTEATTVVKVHGNSLKSQRPTWGYKLYSTDGTFLKNGITSQKIPEKRYTKSFMEDKRMEPIELFPNRQAAWDWEYQENLINRGPLNKNMH